MSWLDEENAVLRTPLYEKCRAAGGRFVAFGGWEMPVQFRGIQAEHDAVRQRAGLFDVSHMGEIEVYGPDAVGAVRHLITNDLNAIADGQALYTAMCRSDGGIVDDLVVYRHNVGHVFICCNASNREKDFAWIEANLDRGHTAFDRSSAYAQVAVQGPEAPGIVQKLTRTDLSAIRRYWFAQGEVAGVPTLISRTGYTGEDGFELYFAPAHAEALWDALFEAGGDALVPVGLGARDTLRLEYKMALYGNDIDDTTTPLEAGLGWVVKLDAGDFIGREALRAQKAAGIRRRLVGFALEGKAIARHGYDVVDEAGARVGQVTSGTRSPTLGVSIGMAYVPVGQDRVGDAIRVRVRDNIELGTVVKTPFIQRG